jgi:SpoVK/Ycf46/Vps4 family AAA+-type ATPase
MVVFFDEIDRLVLDRDTIDYKSQGDMLQFMTPSMLTKINDLRRTELVIFMVGTNYADRIDSAIKRAGRIDERLLVLPPDLSRREQVIRDALQELGDARADNLDEIKRSAIAAYWRTIAEVKSAVRLAARSGLDLAEAMTTVIPAISLQAYISRLNAGSGIDGAPPPSELLEEAFLLAYLLMEGRDDQPFPGRYDSLADRWVARDVGVRDNTLIRDSIVVRDSTVEQALDKIFARSR